ncbi:MAG: hypothetical protein JXA74_03700, partial [Anaerolineae bacterium]|nr:hypothetical protein [Anaerolineae bacterium]
MVSTPVGRSDRSVDYRASRMLAQARQMCNPRLAAGAAICYHADKHTGERLMALSHNTAARAATPVSGRVPLWIKVIYGSGDWGMATFGTVRQIFYAIFLTDVVG